MSAAIPLKTKHPHNNTREPKETGVRLTASVVRDMVAQCTYRGVSMAAFRANGLYYPRTTMITFSPEARMRLLVTGRFLGIFPASALRLPTRHPEIKILPVDLSMARVPTAIVTLKNRTLGPVARLFIEHPREVAKPLAKKK